jgi:Flp pilus assembly pilin Flp
MRNIINRFRRDEDGITMIEYGIMGALIAAALVTGVGILTGGINGAFSTIVASL